MLNGQNERFYLTWIKTQNKYYFKILFLKEKTIQTNNKNVSNPTTKFSK